MGRDYVVTVTGEIPASHWGVTSAHEHLYCDISASSGKKDNVLTDFPLMVRELEYYRGAYCGFDMVGWRKLMPDEIRAEPIAALIELGYERQLLLGTDTCRLSQLYENGGRGLDFLWRSFLPRLGKLGVAHSQIEAILVEAPRTLLSRR